MSLPPKVRNYAGLAAFHIRPARAVEPDYLAPPAMRDLFLKQWREIVFSESDEFSRQARALAAKLSAHRRDVDLEVGE